MHWADPSFPLLLKHAQPQPTTMMHGVTQAAGSCNDLPLIPEGGGTTWALGLEEMGCQGVGGTCERKKTIQPEETGRRESTKQLTVLAGLGKKPRKKKKRHLLFFF